MIEILKTQISSQSPCEEGLERFNKSSDNDLILLFFKYIDFCLAKNWPDIEFIKQVPGIIEAGIYPDRKLIRHNPKQVVALGKSDIELMFTDYAVSRVCVKHDSVVYIKASGNSVVIVDALDNAQVHVKAYDQAKVHVNLYANAIETGATKTIIKNMFTYDLQVE